MSLRYDLQTFEGEVAQQVIVAPAVGNVKKLKDNFDKGVWWGFPVLVMLLTPGNKTVSEGLEAFLTLHTAIRDRLYQVTLTGSGTVFDTAMAADAVSKFAAVVGSNYRVSGWAMQYTSAEKRTA